jgi:hypothetical protein
MILASIVFGSNDQLTGLSQKWCVTKAETSPPNCVEDGGRSPGIGLQGQVPNHRVLLRSKGVVVSDAGKVVR